MFENKVRPNGPRIRELRRAKKWTQEQLAEKACCSKRTVENIEASKNVTETILGDIAVALDEICDFLVVKDSEPMRTAEHGRQLADENWHTMIESGFRIRVLTGLGAGQVFPLNRTRMIVGRGRDCDIVLLEPTCSRVGFDLEWNDEKGGYSLRSLSRNPVLINDAATGMEPVLLDSQDQIRLGYTLLVYEVG